MSASVRAMNAAAALRQEPRRHSGLRIATVRVLVKLTSLLGGRARYPRAHLARGRFLLREERIGVPDLPRGLEGFTIAQLSDLHAGAFLGRGGLSEVVEEVNRLGPDLVAITGDLISSHWTQALPILDDLAGLRSTCGTLAVFGNHDYRDRSEHRIVEAFRERGIRFLRNECARFDTGDGTLAAVGVEDLEEARVLDLEAARAGLREGDVEVVLCHNPAGGPALARPGCAAVLAGHTHGHQIDLPVLRRAGPPHPGLRVELGPTALVISRGLGVVGLPLRVGAPAEVVVVRLTRQEG